MGGGPFPTELNDAIGEGLRKTRGRVRIGHGPTAPHRLARLAGAALSAVRVNGLDGLALTKLDVLDKFDEIPVCVGYNVRSEVWKTFPAFAVAHHDYKPEYRMFKGWKEPTVGMTSYDDLPQAAKDYVRFMEDEVECQATIISTGPRREETIVR